SLIANKAENLVVTGRCISVSHEALGAVRVTPLAMALGQAAGTAAALAAGTGGSTLVLDTAKLRATLIRNGAFLETYAG
ncbi:MAG: FAD-dependent oxidoreductase, partial [Spirochaetaceae bacterium]|nr:FAD-dependent oxidoreductase [Spirochaetaceae bacterium]